MARAAVMLTAPTSRRPAPFGISTVADVQSSDAPWAFGGAQVEIDVCAVLTSRASPECQPEDEQATSEVVRASSAGGATGLDVVVSATGTQEVLRESKVLTPTYGGVTESDPFYLYLLDGCRTVGMWADAEARVRRSFEIAESAGVDAAVLSQILDDPFIVTGGNGCLADAIGRAEEHAAKQGWGQPIIMLARSYAPAAFRDNLLIRSGDHLETQTGSLVALVPDRGPDEGTGLLTLVPWLVLLQGSLEVSGPTVDMVTNEFIALAERSYLALFPCAATVQFTADICCCASGDGGIN